MPKTGWAWRRAATTLALTTLLAVGGCVGAEPADVPTTPTADKTPTPTPSATADLTRLPEKPAAMAEPTTDGAIAAATYVLDLYTYTINTGDVAPWRAITLDSCSFCQGVVADVAEVQTSGDAIRGGAIDVRESRATEISEDTWFSVELDVVQELSERRDADDALVGQNPPGTYTAVFALSWVEGWRVDEMGIQTPTEPAAGKEAG
ncbi:DUF6318 family protein [Cellulomonas xiejunii]|uniref:DUF6318 family protein n=1 Tax=Cellulomonas xiejunii TaxID=2968083 RepID=UPI001D0F234D|nr:DUF6318 family protein [Cellulomonas xiejunii]MCC2314194.1 DUF6318 family protein [Cellulomonas xiejunii]